MEELARSQKMAKNLLTAFCVALIFLPPMMYFYMTSDKYEAVFSTILQFLFVMFIFCGVIGASMMVKVTSKIEDDIFDKIHKSNENYKLTKIGYNSFKLEEKHKELYIEKAVLQIDLNSRPSSHIEIDIPNKTIFYKDKTEV